MRKLLLTILFTLLASPAYAAMVPSSIKTIDQGLVGWWTFDGNNMIRNVTDSGAYRNDAKLINFVATSTAVVVGKIGQGLKFDGVDDYAITTTWSNIASAPITTSGWIKMASTTDSITNYFYSERGNCVASGNFGFGFYVGPSGKPGFVSYGVLQYDSITSPRVDDNKWHHVVAVYDSGYDVTFYVDGIKYDKKLHSANMTGKATCPALIGAVRLTTGYPNNISNFTKATFDDIRIYNRLLSDSEIKQLYNTSAKVNQSIKTVDQGLVGWWTFDGKDMVNGVALDKSGLGNNGKLTNISTSTFYAQGKIGQGVNFDGVNDYVTTPLVLSNSQPFSVSVWIKTNNKAGCNIIFSQDSTGTDDITLCYTPGNYIGYENETDAHSVDSITGFGPATLDTNWHHIVVVEKYTTDVDGNDYYIDGIKQSSNSGAVGNPTNTTFIIGNRSAADSAWGGSLDDVRIYNRALSASEVKMLYNNR